LCLQRCGVFFRPDQAIVFQQFWPKSEGSVFTNSLREQQQQQQQASNIGGRLPEPLVPLKVGSQPTSMADDSACDEEFSALAEWAKGSFMPKATEMVSHQIHSCSNRANLAYS
jgi:hypothetical protein